MFGGFGFYIGALHAERVGIFVHGGDKFLRERVDTDATFVGAGNDFVVYVGDVAHIGERVAVLAQPAGNYVKHHQHAGVPEVAVVIHGHAAHIHAHVLRVERDKGFFLAGEGVVNG